MLRYGQIKKVKVIIGDHEIDDALLDICFDVIDQRVKYYCHRLDLPLGLQWIIIQIVAEYYQFKCIDGATAEDGVASTNEVTSITRGDTRIEYGSRSDSNKVGIDRSDLDLSIHQFVHNYSYQLHAYRKLVS